MPAITNNKRGRKPKPNPEPDIVNGGNTTSDTDPNDTAGNTDSGSTGADFAGFESIFDPTGDAGTGDGGTATGAPTGKRRGRPPGTATAGTLGRKKTVLQDLDTLETLLLSIHGMGAAILSAPEMEIEPSEAKKLAEAIERVRLLYPTNFNPKAMAWLNLATTLGGCYGLRFMAIRNRLARARRTKLVTMPDPAPAAAPAAPVPAPQRPAQVANGSPLTPSQIHPAAPRGDWE